MVIQIGEKSEGSFDNPMGLLNDCHRRIERFLSAMVELARFAQGGSLNEEQREALSESLRYFRESAPKHTQDEEESLFPRLSHLRNPKVQAVLARIGKLRDDHAVADKTHREIEDLAGRWLKDGRLPEESARRLAGLLEGLSDHYYKHILLEETEVFPIAARALEKSDLDAIGREMAERRGVGSEEWGNRELGK
jgi:hemerythrin-like domain-containing protein